MKKLLVLALAALLVLGLATVSMAAATMSGEISVRMKGANDSTLGTSTSEDFTFGKITLSGKLGDDLTGTLVIKGDSVTAPGPAWDEASLLFTEDWGTFKAGFFGWNNNVKDILDVVTADIKSETVLNVNMNVTDEIGLGLVYAYTGTSNWGTAPDVYANPYAAQVTYTADALSLAGIYFHYAENDTAWGVNGSLKLGDVMPFVEYRNESIAGVSAVDNIVGATYVPAGTPVSLRGEIDLDTLGLVSNPWGIRFEYKLEDSAVVRLQYKNAGNNTTAWEARLTAPF